MQTVLQGNLADLGRQLDDVHEQIASARIELKAANEQAKQVVANAQSEAATIRRAADKQADDIIQTARARIEKPMHTLESDNADDLENRAAQVEREGQARYGDGWPKLMNAIGRANPNGIAPESLRQVLAQPNAADVIAAAGRDFLIDAATNGERMQSGIIRKSARKGGRSIVAPRVALKWYQMSHIRGRVMATNGHWANGGRKPPASLISWGAWSAVLFARPSSMRWNARSRD